YLVETKKARVPGIIKTKHQKNYVEAGGKLWFVAEWIEPLEPVTKDLEGAKLLCGALGEFHRLSKGYVPPNGAEIASRLYKWPDNYQKVALKMDWFRNISNVYEEMPASSYLLSVVDEFEKQAQDSLRALNNSHYSEMVKLGNQQWGLVHQDYGWSNGQKGPNGMWIIDLDGVAYDLPIRDLRKLISGTMADLNKWDATWIREMIKAYHQENPISPELYDILMIDLSLPNEFYKNVKEVVYMPETFLNMETKQMIQRIVNLENTKWSILKELQDDWKGVKQ
ncbi:MAG: CotS family spore coat protein, partial [Heyndrickxia sp.]